ncbi:MAG: acetyl-CoA carboxylase biotin carboxyl carrier protein subunit [Bacteroidales bacterium]
MDIVAEAVSGGSSDSNTTASAAKPIINANSKSVASPMPGKILAIRVQQGEKISKGQTVAVLEAMKMENDIVSNYDGIVNNILVNEGDSVSENTKIVDIVVG